MEKNYTHWTIHQCLNAFKTDLPQLIKIIDESESIHRFISQLQKIAIEKEKCSNGIQKAAATALLSIIENENQIFRECSTEENVHNRTLYYFYSTFKDGIIEAESDFYIDMYFLFSQLFKDASYTYTRQNLIQDMARWKDGLEKEVIQVRRERKKALIRLLYIQIERFAHPGSKYHFERGETMLTKLKKLYHWWDDFGFQLAMAARTPLEVDEYMEQTLSPEQLDILYEGYDKNIPFFVTPYYASLLDVHKKCFDDATIRNYILYSKELVKEFGKIRAWEKEDTVESNKPNAAGWLLPNNRNIHRRYPEVAIFIPDSMGRACGGLCSLCQRMYGFQKGVFQFNLDKLKPKETFETNLRQLMKYFREDTQIRDILITGGDALMSQTRTLKMILNEIYNMALAKKQDNEQRKDGEKYAEIQRIRLGSRLPIYLPQRITPQLLQLLSQFQLKAREIGISQFIIQTHIVSPLEITPESKKAIESLQSCGWTITNQVVFTTQASRRGHTAKLRATLNKLGILNYYTFTVKGYNENKPLFTPNSRSLQEIHEGKIFGQLSDTANRELIALQSSNTITGDNIRDLMQRYQLPFLSTDRNVLNLPAVGKSMSFKTIGITSSGQRILKFTHDSTRKHSPIILHLPEMIIVENRSINSYLHQLTEYGEDLDRYRSIWSYYQGETEPKSELYSYPSFPFRFTDTINHLSTSM